MIPNTLPSTAISMLYIAGTSEAKNKRLWIYTAALALSDVFCGTIYTANPSLAVSTCTEDSPKEDQALRDTPLRYQH